MVGVLVAALLLLPGAAAAECDSRCERQTAFQLLNRGETRAAVDSLKAARARFPEDRERTLLLARAYMLEDNLFWAERTLREGLVHAPGDPELLAWLAAVHLRQGDPELAAAELERTEPPADDPRRARRQLLEAARLRLADEPERSAALLDGIDRGRTLFPEDLEAWQALRAAADPWWFPSVSGTLELGLGGTSNALAGSPTDPAREGDASGLALVELRGRVAPPLGARTRPALDLELLGDGIGAEDYRELSTLQTALRAGALVAGAKRRWGLFYRGELLYLNQDEALFSQAHRGELEVEWASGTVALAGGGRRVYRDERRTRWEGDLGVGGRIGRLGSAPLLAGATARAADACSPAYDQLGLSAALSARFPLGAGTALRAALSAVWDDYHHSGGLEGLRVFGTTEKRRDLLGRVELAVHAPAWRKLRPVLELRYTERASTADRPGFDFSYRELRAVAWLRWSFASEPWGPRARAPEDHVPLDWGLEGDRGLEEERILDLLRRDEELRRGSSCGLR